MKFLAMQILDRSKTQRGCVRVPLLSSIRSLTPIVPKGHDMNSRGREPTGRQKSIFDPEGVAPSSDIPPWVFTHGYSCLAASRPDVRQRGLDANRLHANLRQGSKP